MGRITWGGRLASGATEDSVPPADTARPSWASDIAISAVLAALMIATAIALGTPSHRQHERAGAALERVLVHDLAAVGAVVVPGSPEHHTQGYADGQQACAAEASSEVEAGIPITVVSTGLEQRMLPNIETEFVGHGRYRISVRRTFGLNPLDWSCWQ